MDDYFNSNYMRYEQANYNQFKSHNNFLIFIVGIIGILFHYFYYYTFNPEYKLIINAISFLSTITYLLTQMLFFSILDENFSERVGDSKLANIYFILIFLAIAHMQYKFALITILCGQFIVFPLFQKLWPAKEKYSKDVIEKARKEYENKMRRS